jgi:hypothetical protein
MPAQMCQHVNSGSAARGIESRIWSFGLGVLGPGFGLWSGDSGFGFGIRSLGILDRKFGIGGLR